jgi:hypothetical protein
MARKLVLTATMILFIGAGTTFGQAVPIDFIKVVEIGRLQQQDAKVAFVDVRSRQEYLIQHIKGALSVPLSAIDVRTQEIPRDGIVVLY